MIGQLIAGSADVSSALSAQREKTLVVFDPENDKHPTRCGRDVRAPSIYQSRGSQIDFFGEAAAGGAKSFKLSRSNQLAKRAIAAPVHRFVGHDS